MPKPYIGFTFRVLPGESNARLYISDHATTGTEGSYQIDTVRSILPPHLASDWTAAMSTNLAAAIGAHPTYFPLGESGGLKTYINNFSTVPCPVGGGVLKPRRIRYVFSDGSSMSLPIGKAGTDILTAFEATRPFLETDDVTIACAHLEGEEWGSLNDIAGVNFGSESFIAPAGSGSYYSGVLTEYKSEITDSVELLPVKIMTTAAVSGQAPGTALPPVFANDGTCIGNVAVNNTPTCPGRSSLIKTRRLIVVYKTNATFSIFEQREAPIKAIGLTLRGCMNNLAGSNAIFCMSYRGESRKNIHLLA